jgi:pimeloyl-ACP methyl ester carboxylesterase
MNVPRATLISGALTIAAALTQLTGCAVTGPVSGASKTYVLVHGAFQDKRAWDEVVPRLERAGAKVITLDMPGRASGNTPPEAATLDAYRDTVLRAIDQQPGEVILVGHSFGGITISNVAERAPERVKTLVYVAAYLPQAGAADQSMAKLSETDQWNQFNKARQNFLLAKDYKTASVLEEDQVMLFCAACSDAAKKKTLAIMQREPLAPAATPVTLSAERYGKVDKVYIATSNDNAVSHTLQQRMIERTPVRKVIKLATGHSPFVEAPDALAAALLSVD